MEKYSGIRRAAVVFAALALSAAAPQIARGDAARFDRGADLRLRQIFIGNVGLNDDSAIADRTFQRYRGRVWGSYAPSPHFSAAARLMWEGRHYDQPDADDYPIPGFETWYSGGVLLDQLAVEFKGPAALPVALKLGRQDLIFGNGWLVLDGTPLDGSRTIYFDAARATYDATAIGTRFDLVYIDQSADTGRFPQPLNGEVEDQTEQHETGVIAYASNTSLLEDATLDGYFIYKHDRPNPTPGNIRINNGAPFPSPGDSGDIYAAGLRADAKPTPNWSVRAEAVYQWGTRNDRDLDALGFNGRLTYAFNDPLQNRLHLDYEYLSGDDPGSSADQAFDPLWGRWPQWSELMIYQWPLETRVGEATNLQRLNVGWLAQVHPKALLTLDYHALFANEESTRTPAQLANLSGDGHFRGHLLTAWLKAKLNEHVSGHLVAEYLDPGDYYADNRRDDSYFVRAELTLTW
ncbi:MAG: alginate export family protein [Thiohalocapsa sp.]|nr:alginate export family protein [Thiohalocapsa sp.]